MKVHVEHAAHYLQVSQVRFQRVATFYFIFCTIETKMILSF
jgi:hypothetical protein